MGITFALGTLRSLASLALVALGAALCGSESLAQPSKLEYAADWSMETSEGQQLGRVHHSAGLERREMNDGGEKIILISRPDKRLSWNLIPSEKMYMEMAAGKDKPRKDDMSQYEIEQTPAGEETLNGVRTTKSKIIMKEKRPDGGKLGGFWWTTREGIVVKMDMLSIEKGSKERIKMELNNLQIGKQDPRLFEVPPGYEKMGGLAGLGKMLMGGGKDAEDDKGAEKEADKDGDKAAKAPEAKKKEGFSIKDALKLLR